MSDASADGRRRFDSRVVVVTGGGSGLGEAMCEAFAREGGKVAVVDLKGDGAKKVADACEGERAPTPATSPTRHRSEDVRAIAEDLGAVEVLVNNAGIARRSQATQDRMLGEIQATMTGGERHSLGGTTSTSDEDWDRMIKVHLYGTFYCTREALKVMERSGAARSSTSPRSRRSRDCPARPTTRPRRPGSWHDEERRSGGHRLRASA